MPGELKKKPSLGISLIPVVVLIVPVVVLHDLVQTLIVIPHEQSRDAIADRHLACEAQMTGDLVGAGLKVVGLQERSNRRHADREPQSRQRDGDGQLEDGES